MHTGASAPPPPTPGPASQSGRLTRGKACGQWVLQQAPQKSDASELTQGSEPSRRRVGVSSGESEAQVS